MLDMLPIRSCFLATAMLASALACTEAEVDPGSELEMIEAEREPETGGWWIRVVEDQFDLVYAEGLELNLVIDPDSLPKDIAGVGTAESMIEIGGPAGGALKVKLKVVVLPAGPTAD
jgi:hypothetical protein